jgi:hypothetical protein
MGRGRRAAGKSPARRFSHARDALSVRPAGRDWEAAVARLIRKGFEVFVEAFPGSKSGFFRDRFHRSG